MLDNLPNKFCIHAQPVRYQRSPSNAGWWEAQCLEINLVFVVYFPSFLFSVTLYFSETIYMCLDNVYNAVFMHIALSLWIIYAWVFHFIFYCIFPFFFFTECRFHYKSGPWEHHCRSGTSFRKQPSNSRDLWIFQQGLWSCLANIHQHPAPH